MVRFKNPHLQKIKRSLWDVLLWRAGRYDDPFSWESPPRGFYYPAAPAPFERGKPSVLWVGHSTFLVEVGGLTILTDPIWSDYCAPFAIPTLKRRVDVPFTLIDLPKIDLVLLSHNHYDHLDEAVVKHFAKVQSQALWIVPQNLKRWLKRRGLENVEELGWWQLLDKGLFRVTAVPAQHFSGRGLLDKNRTHWNGYVLEVGKKRMYFTGDTGYNPIDFKEIGARFSGMDLSLIPIGTYSPKRFMETVHISPYESVKIHREVKSFFSVGMHWKTFRLSEEPMDRPPYDLYLAMQKEKLAFETFMPLEIGLYVNW